MSIIYENRYVVFIDILGFKDIVSKSNNDDKKAEKILENLKYIEEIKKENDDIYKLTTIGRKIAVFSDSIVISYPLLNSGSGQFLSLIFDIIYIFNELLDKGVYIRGGMTYGKLYHEGNVCFGPAMVEAYSLEQEAIYPRIIIDEIAIKEGLNYPGLDGGKIKWNDIKELFVIEDGICYIDFLFNALEEFEYFNEYIKYLEKVRENLNFHLKNNNYSSKVLRKYSWFRGYYNKTIKKIIQVSSKDKDIGLDKLLL